VPSRALKNASVVQVHYGSARFPGRILLLDRRELLPGETAIARLRFTRPAFVFAGDRFLIRDSSGRQTVAGGVVLNPNAEGTRFRASAERSFLQARAAGPNDLITLLRTQLQRDKLVRRAALLLQSSFSEEEMTNAVNRLAGENEVFTGGAIVADVTWWGALRQRAIDAIDTEHAAHPERAGLDLAQLRAHLSLEDAELENALIADLSQLEFDSAQGSIKRRSHQPALPAVLSEAARKILAPLAARPFDPPSRKELIVDAAAHQALRFLSETGEVVVLNEDVLVSADACEQMKSRIAQALRTSGPATVSELRQMLGTTRRIVIPLLERCDREGLTSRQGDRRALRAPRA
jgi:selenocysteine-specific elongation factor